MVTMLETAMIAAKASGEILIENLGKIKEINFKERNDHLTNVDIEAENEIKSLLKKAFPHHGFVAEESEAEAVHAEYKWFIDPLSSTVNYIHGLPHFATAIALQRDNDFILSVVFDPFFNELFYAEKGKGAFLNGKKIAVSSVKDTNQAMIFLGILAKGQNKKQKIDEGLEYFSQIIPHVSAFRRIGSTALQFCYVACGRADAFVENNNDIFAIPAGKVILEEAGGKLTDFQGNPWNLDSKNILGTNGKIHQELQKYLQ